MEEKDTRQPVIRVVGLTKDYKIGKIVVPALKGINLEVYPGEVVAIMGPSGSGKSTLMNLIGCLDVPTSGDYYLNGELVSNLDDDELAEVRNKQIGFVFQKFNLLPRANAIQNVELPLHYSGDHSNAKEKATRALVAVGLGDRMGHKPNELSGGEQQRVAIARSIINEPAIVLADEPTGNLDTQVGQGILDLLLNLNKTQGSTIVIVTHDPDVAARTQRTVQLRDGLIINNQGAK